MTKINLVEQPDCSGKNRHYAGNQTPLKPSPIIRLPLGAVKAVGWLATQLDLMADGQVGRLDELSKFLNADSGWLGGPEAGWEEAPYWLRGYYALSVLTGQPRLQETANRWIESVIVSQREDGYYGSDHNRLLKGVGGQEIVDIWPHAVMNDALISHYEATGDDRILSLLTRFFTFCSELPDHQFLPQMSWDHYENYREHFGDWKPRIQIKRAGDLMPHIFWLYNQTGDRWLLDLAIKVYHRTQPAMNQWLDNHTVHFSQRFRYPAQMFPVVGDERYLRMSELFYDGFMKTWGQMPRGAHAADERIRMGKIDPRQGIETCSLGELNKSHYILSEITGDSGYADRIEDITFNHLPASHAPDHRSLRYLTASNMPLSVAEMDFKNSGQHPVFTADSHRCCQHNTAQAWPSFVRHLWFATPDNGLIAWLYSPNTVTAKVGESGHTVRIQSNTSYPFGESVSLVIDVDNPVRFPLYCRIPGWSHGTEIRIGDEKAKFEASEGKMIRIEREWQSGDVVQIQFAAEVSATTWPRSGAITIDRGPLSYSVRIKEDWTRESGGPDDWPRQSIKPASQWNYGLEVDPNDLSDSVTVSVSDRIPDQPWQESAAPIVLKVPAKRIPEWQTQIKHTVDSLRESPVKSSEPQESIDMIPMGCAHLRMSVLPVVSERSDARKWEDIPNPDEYMLDRLDQ